jgi:hypothetical protein
VSDWRWFDKFIRGDPSYKDDLAAQADRDVSKHGRQPTRHVSDTPSHSGKEPGGGDSYLAPGERRHRGHGRGETGPSHKGHANEWSQREYDAARRDYERQQRGERGIWQQDRRSLRDVARDLRDARRDPDRDRRREERREAAADVRRENAARAREARDDYRQGRPPPGYRGW